MSENTINTAVATIDETVTPGRRVQPLSTIVANTFEERVNILNLMGGSTPVSENLNKVLQLENIIVQPVEMADQETGVFGEVPRVTMITTDGKSYHATSGPLYRALMDILFIMGHPSEWATPLPVKITKGGSGTRQFFDLKVAPLGSK